MKKVAALGLVLLIGCTGDVEITGGGGVSEAPTPPTDAEGNYLYEDSRVVGIVTDRAGAVAEGAGVDVIATDTGSGIDEALLAIISLGLACLPDGECGPSESAIANATTGPDGAYDFVLPEGYLPGYETDTDWIVTARRAGATSLFEFEANAAVQEAPPLPLWDTAPTIEAVNGLLRVDVADAPDLHEPEGYIEQLKFYDREGLVLWTVAGATVDARLLEDVPSHLVGVVNAAIRVPHGETRTIYHQRLSTPPTEYAGTLVPLSRGAACTTEPAAIPGCPVTDGDLNELSFTDRVTVDLAAAHDVGLIVVRGCDGCTVEASTDGTSWSVLATQPLTGTRGLSAGRPDLSARYVRVTAEVGTGLVEISVWPATEATGHQLLDGSSDDDDDGPIGVLVTVAAILAVLGLAYGSYRVWRQLRGPTNMPA